MAREYRPVRAALEDGGGGEGGWSQEQMVAIDACLEAVENQKGKFRERGLSNCTWFFGVFNTIFVAWNFGSAPQNFWLLYMLETAILFPIKFSYQVSAAPLSQVLHWLDFCWVANFTGNAVLLYLLVSDYDTDVVVDDDLRKRLFCFCWGIATGPLMFAVFVLGNPLIFHDLDSTTNTFIHLFPNFVMYTLRWHRTALMEAWPGLFRLDYFDDISIFMDIYVSAATFYFLWLVVYACWLLIWGLRCPSQGYDTVFHVNMRGGFGKLISGWLGLSKEEHAELVEDNDFGARHALPYLFLHGLAVGAGILASAVSWERQSLHGALTWLTVLSMCFQGAKKYNHFLTESYASTIRSELGIE